MSDDDRILMCPENVREGIELGPIFCVITAEQVEAFARATGADNPLYTAQSPAGVQIAPPTMRLLDYALLISKHFRGGSGGVHAKHRNQFFAPMRVGQSVRTDGRITKTWRKRGKFYFELEYESRDVESDELLMRQAITAVLLVEGRMQ